MPAPVAGELGRPAKITFRRSGNRFAVEPAGPKKAAAGAAAGRAAAQAAGAAGARPLKDGLPSEMSLETNILRYLANCLERRHGLAEGAVVPVSPTQHEEQALGFDAAVGLPQGRYVVLQFKRPEKAGHGRARFRIGGEQALTLLRYPRGSAFYVLPPVRTNGEMAGLGRCLLRRACMVDAWDMLPPILRSWRPARTAPARSGGKGGSGAKPGDVRAAYVDCGGECGAVYVQAGRGHQPPYHQAQSKPASTLCDGADDVGFDVRDGRMEMRNGGGWGCGRWRAEAGRALEMSVGRAYRWGGSSGGWRAGEGAAAADDAAGVGPARPNLDEVERRFRQACGRGEEGADGGEGSGSHRRAVRGARRSGGGGGGTYWLWIASAP